MSFATLYIDDGNLLGFFDDLESVRAEVVAHAAEFPETGEVFGFVELDGEGRRVGEFVTAGDVRRRESDSLPSA